MNRRGTEGTEGTDVTPATTKQHHHSYLFLLRIWSESEGQESDTGEEEQQQWCGKLQYVLSPNAQSFHDWPALVDLLMVMLPDLQLNERHSHQDTPIEDGE